MSVRGVVNKPHALYTGTQLLIVIIDATWNVNACYYEVSYASASLLRMRRSTSSVLGRQIIFGHISDIGNYVF